MFLTSENIIIKNSVAGRLIFEKSLAEIWRIMAKALLYLIFLPEKSPYSISRSKRKIEIIMIIENRKREPKMIKFLRSWLGGENS